MTDTNTTWKQVVYDAADAYRTASATTANIKVGELAQKISTLEDVTAEVTTQTPLIEDIIEALETKGITPTNGLYIWQKSDGSTTEYVVSDDPSTYPDDGEQGGFTYKKIQTTETTEITPGTTDQTIPALSLLLNALMVKGDADLVASNIRSGVDIFGVIGTLVEGKSGIDFGTVTLSSSQSKVTVTHNLGKKPSFFLILIPNDQESMRMGYYWNYYGYDLEGLSRQLYYTIPTGDTSTSNTLTFNDLDRNNTYYWFAIA